MKGLRTTFLILVSISGFISAQQASGKTPSCVHHLCTASLLACPTGRLAVNEDGCELCRCEENPSSRRRSCPLHGCTVGLLKCVGKLQRRADGCTLCQCDEQGVLSRGPQLTSGNASLSNSSDVCPTISCNLDCEKLRQSPITGCPMCECDTNTEDQDFCPNAREIISGEGMTRGTNNIVAGSIVPKYKISIGKLRKGFLPNQSHKIILKALDNNFPFREFLLELQPSPQTFVRSRRKRKQKVEDLGGRREDRPGCGVGYWYVESNVVGSVGWRPFPLCSTAATEADKSENKTTLTLTWVAPRCGCIYVRASVIDYTGSRVYYDDSLTRSAQSQLSRSGSGRTSNPLYRSICVRPSAVLKKNRGKKNNHLKKKSRRDKRRNWIVVKCCRSGRKQRGSPSKCARKAALRANSFRTRFTVVKRTCKSAFLTCCLLADSQRSDASKSREGSQITGADSSRRTGLTMDANSSRGRSSSQGIRTNSRLTDNPMQKGRNRSRKRNNRRRQNQQQRQGRLRNKRRFRYRN